MPQPFAVGDVVGGRYRITHHVVTSADQDIVFEGTDQVLNREVSILLASRSNAKQVATSAKELATGERVSDVQVLDLGLAEDRTYLIASLTDPNGLLDLVVPDAAPYVEPFFTDSLGSEIFGQSRVMEPETYHDDEEYYAALTESESETGRRRPAKRRPGFLDRVSDTLNRRLGTSESRGAGNREDEAEAAAQPGPPEQSGQSEAEQAVPAAEGSTGDDDVASSWRGDQESTERHASAGSSGQWVERTDDEAAEHAGTAQQPGQQPGQELPRSSSAEQERAETEAAVNEGQEALEQRAGIAEEPLAPVAAYRDAELPEIPQPELPEHIDDDAAEEPEELTDLPEDTGGSAPSEVELPEESSAESYAGSHAESYTDSHTDSPAEIPAETSTEAPEAPQEGPEHTPAAPEEPEEFSASAAGVSAVPAPRPTRPRRRPERTSGIAAGIPALADLSIAEVGAAADTPEAFGVRAAQDGQYVPLSEAEAARPSLSETPDDAGATGDHEEARGAQPAGDAVVDPWADDPDPEDVIDDPPAEPITEYDRHRGGSAGAAAGLGAAGSAAVGSDVSGELHPEQPEPGTAAFVEEDEPRDGREPVGAGSTGTGSTGTGAGPGRWIALSLLGVVLLIVAIIIFTQLGGGDQTADEGSGEEEENGQAEGSDDGEEQPELSIASVTREVPENAELGEEFDADLENLLDDDESTAWSTYNYGNATYGGYASEMAVIAELEEPGEVQQVTVDQDPAQQGGAFEVLVNDEPTLEGATNVGEGSFGEEPAVVELSEPTEAQYVILNVTELPENSEPENPDLPYRLDLRELDVS